MIIHGDCLIKLKELPENSVDSIVTDPPYELGFMGKSWDSTGIANNVEMWAECLRVLKPGGHLLAFSGTRTYHRMAVAIEDAGFEVRDMIEWVYGSGFPKSLNIGKAVDKLKGNERMVIGNEQKAKPTFHSQNVGGEIKEIDNINITKGTSDWEGWGTALKPAHEPICMARKPLAEKTVAENCLKWGTGGINIDESRIPTTDNLNGGEFSEKSDKRNATSFSIPQGNGEYQQPIGRFPANLIHDNSEEVRECFPESVSKQAPRGGQGFHNAFGRPDKERLDGEIPKGHNDSGNASRFFKSIIYQAKASKSERNRGCEELDEKNFGFSGGANGAIDRGEDYGEGQEIGLKRVQKMKNNHPTVKPIALMEYLIKMVTPKGGIVLDPFMGSGSTGVAAKQNGYHFIGIEMEADYIKIAEARMSP